MVRECYSASLSEKLPNKALMVSEEKGKRASQTAEPVEDLLEVPLDSQSPDQKVWIGRLLSPKQKERLVRLLSQHRDVFVWIH